MADRAPAELGLVHDTSRLVGRLLTVGTIASVALAAAGVAAMLLAGETPVREPGPLFRPLEVPADLVAGHPDGLLWAALTLTVALPSARVALAGLGFLAEHDRRQAGVALAVLAVLGISLGVAIVTR